MQAAPMARLQQGKQAAVTTGKAGTTGIPCAMGLRLTPWSPRCAGLFSHRRSWHRSRTWRQRRGARTTRLDRTRRLRSSRAAVASIAPRLTFRDDWP